MTTIPDIPCEQARARRGERMQAALSVAQADLYAFEWEGRPAVLKDFNARPAWARWAWSRHICAREARILHHLNGLDGATPRLLAMAGPCAFVMERMEGTRLPRKKEAPPPPEFWARAREALERLHAAGISHGDIRRTNMLMTPDGRACLIDFATAARDRRGGLDAWVSRRVFLHARRIDRVTFARIKASYDPESLDAKERAWLADEPWQLRAGRWLKRHVYRLRKPGALKRRLAYWWRWLMVKLGFRSKFRHYH
jgi:tRNA A-37 threonylcarbamoyl transferase component Bud32